MIKWQATRTFIFGGIQNYIIPTRDEEVIMKVAEGGFIYESEEIARLIVNDRYVNGGDWSEAWKDYCVQVGTLIENEVGDTPLASSGEANTLGSMTVTGESLSGTKSGVELRTKSLIAGTNVTLSSTADSVTINSTGGGGTPGDTVVSETTYGQTSTAGTATDYSREDHTHGSPDAQTSAEVSYDNTASGLAATDAQAAIDELDTAIDGISVPTAANSVVSETAFGNSTSVGSNTTEFAREDHTHGTPVAPVTTLQEITAGQGDITGDLTLDAGSNVTLTQVGNTVTVASTGGGTPATTVVTETAYGQTSSVGTDLEYAREDHTHGTPTLDAATIAAVAAADTVVTETAFGQASTEGTADDYSRADHTHGTPADPGTAPTPANAVTSEVAFDLVPATGSNTTEFAREDHTHGSPATPVTTLQEITVGQGDITGDLTLTAGANITLTQVGNTVDIGATGAGGVNIEDEGVSQGAATTLDYVGAGVTTSVTAGVATINIPGGAGTPTQRYISGDAVITASAAGVTFAKLAGVGTLTIPATVDVYAVRVNGVVGDLDASQDFTIRTTYSGAEFNNTDADAIFPEVSIIDRSSIVAGGPSTTFPYTHNNGVGGVGFDYVALGSGSLDTRANSLNGFTDWSIILGY